MRTQVAHLAIGSILLGVGALPAPALAQSSGPANDTVAECKAAGDFFTVGQCLALTRENSTNEYAAACTAFRAELPFVDEDGNVIRTIADCIEFLRTLED